MKKLTLGIAAAALLATGVLATAAPAMAQIGFYAGPGGVGVGVGPAPAPYGYYDDGYYAAPGAGYYDYYNGPVWNGGHYWHHHWRR